MIPLTDSQCQAGMQQLCDLARNTAKVSGLRLNAVVIDNGQTTICKDAHSLQLTARGKTVTVKIFHEDVVAVSELTKKKIQNAVNRLQIMLEL